MPRAALEPMFDTLAGAAKKAAAIGGGSLHEAGETDSEVICCESAERTAVLVDLARTFGLPYVAFQMIFVEGVLLAREDADFQMCQVPMLAAWLSLGDYDNIFALRRLAPKGACVDHLHSASLHQLSRQLDFDLFDEYGFSPLEEHELAPGRLLLAHHLPAQKPDPHGEGGSLPPAVGLALRVALPADVPQARVGRHVSFLRTR